MGKYLIRCLSCGKKFTSEKYLLNCDRKHPPSLLRSEYNIKKINQRKFHGMFQYMDWLPVEKPVKAEKGPITYKSQFLAKELGLSDLYIGFSGYWPEKNVYLKTGTFKELEALPTIARIKETANKPLIVASAGNTARAFAHVCNSNNMPVCLVVNKSGAKSLWLSEEVDENIKLILVNGDYFDAINFASKIVNLSSLIPEGGARNIARRDGMATVTVDAIMKMKTIPDHYFQAVGSGTGAIASWEANLRFLKDGRFGRRKMKLHLSQNNPFTPIHDCWEKGICNIKLSEDEAKKRINSVFAKVLTNRNPPYSITGGVFDALTDTKGETYSVSNKQALEAEKMFNETEGIDIAPAAAVCVASLIQAINENKIGKNQKILINVTGGGFKRLKEDYSLFIMKPNIITENTEENAEKVIHELNLIKFANQKK